MTRVEFSPAARRAIIHRASEHGVPYCEECGSACPTPDDYEVDHIVAEGHRSEDRRKPLTSSDGRLLCKRCHKGKTARDIFSIAKGTRQQRKHRTVAVALGPPALARRGFKPATER